MEKAPTFCLIGNREGEINGCRIILALGLYSVPYNRWYTNDFSMRSQHVFHWFQYIFALSNWMSAGAGDAPTLYHNRC